MTSLLAGSFLLALGAVACVAVPQGEVCKEYLTCQEHYDTTYALVSRDLSSFEAEGICWRSAGAASDCEESCSVAISSLKAALQDDGADLGSCN